MKDDRGHGSNSRGQQAARGLAPAAHSLKIQTLNTSLGTGPDIHGQWKTSVTTGASVYHGGPLDGQPTSRPSAKAEQIAQYMRRDERGLYAKNRGSNPNPTRVK